MRPKKGSPRYVSVMDNTTSFKSEMDGPDRKHEINRSLYKRGFSKRKPQLVTPPCKFSFRSNGYSLLLQGFSLTHSNDSLLSFQFTASMKMLFTVSESILLLIVFTLVHTFEVSFSFCLRRSLDCYVYFFVEIESVLSFLLNVCVSFLEFGKQGRTSTCRSYGGRSNPM